MAAAVIAFLFAMWLSSFLFPNATRWCLEIVPPSSLGALAAIQRHASKRWLISKRSGCAAELIRLGVEQKPKRHCSLEHTRLSDEQTTKRPVT
jgi:phage terminase Nu1 subunit (DNA packaging protein)